MVVAVCLSASVLMFWLSQDIPGWGVGVFPLANDSVQVRLVVDKTQQMYTIYTRGNGGLGSDEEKELQNR